MYKTANEFDVYIAAIIAFAIVFVVAMIVSLVRDVINMEDKNEDN